MGGNEVLALFEGELFDQNQVGASLLAAKEELYYSLKKKIMKVGKQKKGDKVTINPQCLKDLYRLVLMELSSQERAAISIYYLQTFLLELSVKPKEQQCYQKGNEKMNFDIFFNFIMACIRLDPNFWIKTSEQYIKLSQLAENQLNTILLSSSKQEGGDNNDGENIAKSNDAQIKKQIEVKLSQQNQDAIASYREYMLAAKRNCPILEHQQSKQISSSVLQQKEEEKVEVIKKKGRPHKKVEKQKENESEDKIYESENEKQTKKSILKAKEILKRVDSLQQTFSLHSVSYYRRGQTIYVKLLPILFRFIEEKRIGRSLLLKEQFILQNFIMFLSFKQKKSKKKRLNKYSLLAMGGQDFEDEQTLFSKKNKFNKKKKESEDEEEYNNLIESDTSLSSILNDDLDYQISMRETNTKYNLRKRPFLSLRFADGMDIADIVIEKDSYKRRKLKDQEEIIQMKEKIWEQLEGSEIWKEFEDFYLKQSNQDVNEKHQIISAYSQSMKETQNNNEKENRLIELREEENGEDQVMINTQKTIPSLKMNLAKKVILLNILTILDYFIQDQFKNQQQDGDIDRNQMIKEENLMEKNLIDKDNEELHFEKKDNLQQQLLSNKEVILVTEQNAQQFKQELFFLVEDIRKELIEDKEKIQRLISLYQSFYQLEGLNQSRKLAFKEQIKIYKKSQYNNQLLSSKEINLNWNNEICLEELKIQGTQMTYGEIQNVLKLYQEQFDQIQAERSNYEGIDKVDKESKSNENSNNNEESQRNADDEEEKEEKQAKQLNKNPKEWTEGDYQKFYEGLEKFKDHQLSNKKISKYMGEHIDPMKVRFEKIKYQKSQRKIKKEQLQKKYNQALIDMNSSNCIQIKTNWIQDKLKKGGNGGENNDYK